MTYMVQCSYCFEIYDADVKEDIKRTAKIISLQKINESEIENEIEDEVERLIERRFLNKKTDFDKIKNAITLELKQLKNGDD